MLEKGRDAQIGDAASDLYSVRRFARCDGQLVALPGLAHGCGHFFKRSFTGDTCVCFGVTPCAQIEQFSDPSFGIWPSQ